MTGIAAQGRENLLAEAPQGRHFAQLAKDAESLTEAVNVFAGTGLLRGEGVLMIASGTHTEAFLRRLRNYGFDPEGCQRSGQLVIMDAEATLQRFMRFGMPDWQAFHDTIGPVLQRLAASHWNGIRAYGEMVNILWQRGNTRTAARLEEYWNDLGRLYGFSLFCAFLLDGLDDESYACPLHEIGASHSEVLKTDEEQRFDAAVDAASQEVLGLSLSAMLSFSRGEELPGEHRIPSGRRTILWLKRNMPHTASRILERTRRYYGKTCTPLSPEP